MPVIETVIPVEFLTARSACNYLSALVSGAETVRAETAALADPEIAAAYLRFYKPAMRWNRGNAHHD